MTLQALSRTLILIGCANACVYAVSRGVDAWLKLPMQGKTIEKYEEIYGPNVPLKPSILWKRGLLVFVGTLLANGILTIAIYAAGLLTEAVQQTLQTFWFLTILFSLPFSEITYLMDRRKPISPIFIGCVLAGWFAAKHWLNMIAKPFLGALALLVMFMLGWTLQRYGLRKRGRL